MIWAEKKLRSWFWTLLLQLWMIESSYRSLHLLGTSLSWVIRTQLVWWRGYLFPGKSCIPKFCNTFGTIDPTCEPPRPPPPNFTDFIRFRTFSMSLPKCFDKKGVKYAITLIYKSLGPPDPIHPHLSQLYQICRVFLLGASLIP